MKYVFLFLLVAVVSCAKETTTKNYKYFQTIQAEFTELDSTQSIVVKQTTPSGVELSSQEYKLTSLSFSAEMPVQNVKPSVFTLYLKDRDGNLSTLESRPLR